MRAKRATYTFWVDKSSLKMPKILNFGEFLKTWSLRSRSVTRQYKNLVENAKMENFICDILCNFQLMWQRRKNSKNVFFFFRILGAKIQICVGFSKVSCLGMSQIFLSVLLRIWRSFAWMLITDKHRRCVDDGANNGRNLSLCHLWKKAPEKTLQKSLLKINGFRPFGTHF